MKFDEFVEYLRESVYKFLDKKYAKYCSQKYHNFQLLIKNYICTLYAREPKQTSTSWTANRYTVSSTVATLTRTLACALVPPTHPFLSLPLFHVHSYRPTERERERESHVAGRQQQQQTQDRGFRLFWFWPSGFDPQKSGSSARAREKETKKRSAVHERTNGKREERAHGKKSSTMKIDENTLARAVQ